MTIDLSKDPAPIPPHMLEDPVNEAQRKAFAKVRRDAPKAQHATPAEETQSEAKSSTKKK